MKNKAKLLFCIAMIFLSLFILASCSAEHEHTFSGEWTIVTNPTAEADGVKSNVCDECKETVESPIEKHEHEFSAAWTISTPATTTENGQRTNVCDICSLKVCESVACCEVHTFSKEWTVVAKPTHLARGRKTNECDLCGATETQYIDMLTITGLEIVKLPEETFYLTGDTFNSKGLVIKAKLSDGSAVGIGSAWQLLTTERLTAEHKSIKVKYKDFILEIPVTVSPAVRATVDAISSYDDGALLYLSARCIGSCTIDGSKSFILEGGQKSEFILLKGASYDYKAGDRLEIFVETKSDSYGKYVEYSEENESPEKTVVSSGTIAAISVETAKNIKSTLSAELYFDSDAKRYEAITFKGEFYLIKSGDGYIVHFNGSAVDESGVRIPSGKIIYLSTENIDGSIISDRVTGADFSSYPGVFMSGSLKALYIDSDSDSINLQILAKEWIKADPYISGEEYLREVAYAFYYQLPYVDYDQYNNRRNINPSPEDATALQTIYLDCSSYVNAVYYNAFGVNIMPYTIREKSANTANFMAYARDNPNAIDVLGYWECRDYDTKEEREALLSELLKNLRVGDVIVYRKGNAQTLEESAGHALIYVGEGKILHCQNTESYTHNGKNPDEAFDTVSSTSIAFESTFNLFESPSATRYLFNYVNFTILRPLNRGLTPTEQTLSRMTIPSLSIEKSMNKGMYGAVFKNDLLTYTIKLTNKGSEDLSGINLLEFVPLGTEFVEASEGILHNAGTISWTGTVEANSTVTLTFTVKVTTEDVGAVIESCSGTVNGLNLNKITSTVSAISLEKLDTLSDKADALVDANTKLDDPILMINALYRELLGKDLFGYASISEALSDIITVSGYKVNPDSAVADMVMTNLSGGYLIRGNNPFTNDRIRAIRIEYLTVGDVIIAEHSTDKDGLVKRQVAFVYLGDDEFIKITSDNGVCEIIEFDRKDAPEIRNILISLYSYEKYAIIRPSLSNSAE